MTFTREDVIQSIVLRDRLADGKAAIEALKEKRAGLKSKEKGRVTREISAYTATMESIREDLKNLPREPMDPAKAYEVLMERILKAKATFEKEKADFVERVGWNPASAIEWAERIVLAQQQWELLTPAAEAEDYDQLVERLEESSEDNQRYLLERSDNIHNSTGNFHNVVNMARHNGRVKAHRWGAFYMLQEIKYLYAPAVESWWLLNGEIER